MASTALTITVDAVVDAAASAFDHVAGSASEMGDSVADAARQADTATGSLDGLASSTDDVAGKTGLMTGALGALAGGLSAVGLEEYAGVLEGAAVATDVVSGSSDLLALALESTKVQWLLAKAGALASAVQYGVTTAATWAMTAAQTALNVVMELNPVALVVIALVALAAGLVIAYQKSETFRDIVDAAFGVVQKAVELVWKAIETLVGWVGDLASAGWDRIKSVAEDVFGPVETAVGKVSDAISTAVGWVQDLIDKIANIHFPDFPDVNPFGRPVFGGAGGGSFTGTAGGFTLPPSGTVGATIQVTVNGAIDPVNTARQIRKILEDETNLYGAQAWGSVP